MNIENVKENFPIFREWDELVYLDNAATSQKPEKVINAVEEFYRESNSNIGRGIYNLANEATQRYEESRSTVANFINAGKDEIVFVRNTTEAENLIANSINFEGSIVLSEMAHHSEQLPWRHKAEQGGKNIEYLETSNGKISIQDAESKIDSNTGLVAVSHISNVFGAVNPVEDIIEIAHKNGALVVLDCAQSAPHQRLDVESLDADFITFSGHKMLGPTGIGVLYGKKSFLDDMRPYQVGGGMVKSVEKDSVRFSDVPHKFEAGTPNIAGAAGLKAAINYLEDLGMDEVERHTKEISSEIQDGLKNIDGVKVLSHEDSTLVSFTAAGAHPHDIAEVLNQKSVAVRAGNHCAQPQHRDLDISGSIRASPYIYSTEEDVQKLIQGVKEAVELFNV